MTMKVVQVPMDQKLLKALQRQCRKERRSRAELVRDACRRYLKRLEDEEADRAYEEAYRRIPEDTAVGKSQVAMLARILPKETW